MALRTTIRLLFILYCVEAGLLIALAPWSPSWDRALFQIPLPWLRNLFLMPLVRGGLTGFGLVHIVWGAHDLELWLAGRRSARGGAAS